MFRHPFLVITFSLLLSLYASSATPANSQTIMIQDAEAAPSPMMLGVVSVFMRISNTGNSTEELIAVRTSVPKSSGMLHGFEDGKMVMLDKISIPAGGVTVLRPGGLHIMLFNMPRDLKPADEFTLYLTFSRSGQQQVKVKVMSRKNGHHNAM